MTAMCVSKNRFLSGKWKECKFKPTKRRKAKKQLVVAREKDKVEGREEERQREKEHIRWSKEYVKTIPFTCQ